MLQSGAAIATGHRIRSIFIMTKETLLKYKWFVDNEYLAKYIAFVNSTKPPISGYEEHHVIPACYYKLKFPKLRISNRTLANADADQEIIKLSRADHIKAHRLLMLCTDGELSEKLSWAYEAMVSGQSDKYNQWIVEQEEPRCWVSNGTKQLKIPKSKLDKYLASGWRKGMLRKKYKI